MLHLSTPVGIRQLSARYKDISKEAGIPSSSLTALLTCFLFGMESVSDLVRACPWVSARPGASIPVLLSLAGWGRGFYK